MGSRRYIAKIGSDGKPDRKINISGGSLGTLLSSFKLIIDQYLYQGSDTAIGASLSLKTALAQYMDTGQQIAPLFRKIYDSFFELTLKMGDINPSGKGIKAVLNYFIDYTTKLSSDEVIKYPLNLSLYQVGENNIWDIWNQMVHPPIGELFGLWDKTEKYQIVFRKTPFENSNWKNLNINNIPSIIMTEFDICTSANEVYTFYYVSLPGSGYSRNENLALGIEGYGFTPFFDTNKWSKFGYKPLMVELRFFNKGKIEEFPDPGSLITELSKDLKDWYEYNDEFLSGKLGIMTIDEKMWDGKLKNPRIGERIKFIDAEFYVEGSDHSWNYGGPMVTTLSVSRGFVYDHTGAKLHKVKNLGAKARTITKKVEV